MSERELYWDAGYQLHIHVNGDLGLEIVLDVLERRMRENPRAGHRSVVVHFATSTEEQIARIARLGAIVSANPYYTVGFADKYGEFGLGPKTRGHYGAIRVGAEAPHSVVLPFGLADGTQRSASFHVVRGQSRHAVRPGGRP